MDPNLSQCQFRMSAAAALRDRVRGVLVLALMVVSVACSYTSQDVPAASRSSLTHRDECNAHCTAAPDLIGMSPARAKRTLEQEGLQNVMSSWVVRVTPHVPKGFIGGQVPWPGQQMRTNSGLDLIISAGPRYRREIRLDFCDYRPGMRCGDSYHAYGQVHVMHRDEIVVGEPVRVPDVGGMPREEAVGVLAAHHLNYRVVPLGPGRDLVQSQQPSKGVLAPAMSMVLLRVDCQPTSSPIPSDADVYDACGGKYIAPVYY